eukprot:3872457-Lingulodinium_polyedra.AAC.1
MLRYRRLGATNRQAKATQQQQPRPVTANHCALFNQGRKHHAHSGAHSQPRFSTRAEHAVAVITA